MGLSLSEQTAYFLWSPVLGLALGALYDIVRALRSLIGARRVHVMISDIIFFALCGVITSLFALPFNKGNVRGFILFGEAVGFLCYRLSVGSILSKFYRFISVILRSIVQKIKKYLEKIFNYLLKAVAYVVYNVSDLIDKSHKAAVEKHQKRKASGARKQSRAGRGIKDRLNEQKKQRKAKYKGKNQKGNNRRRRERR